MKTVVVIGAGAAGCFGAIEIKRGHPEWDVLVLEAGREPMMKLAVTGGGRCNLTNSFGLVSRLSEVYPRGEQLMKRALKHFSNEDLMAWFEKEGVRLVVQDDECVFPQSQDAMQIVRTLENLMKSTGVRLFCNVRVRSISAGESFFELQLDKGEALRADRLLVTVGGSSQKTLQAMLPVGMELTPTLPSLFTFKIADASLRALMGLVVQDVVMSLAGTSFRSRGTLLLTDWGVSGPATLKLSSYAARHLAENKYQADLVVNWLAAGEADVREWLTKAAGANKQKYVSSVRPEGIPDRLWRHILQKSGIRADLRWAELGTKGRNRLVGALVSDTYRINGRASFKEEFVTCGGVALSEVNLKTLESKKFPGLYFAGEVLDVDAVTGGFNLQAAWSMAKVVADSIL